MKLKKLAILALAATPALVLASCGGSDSKEKQAPNNLAFVDANGQEQTLVIEATDDKEAINVALAALRYNSNTESIQTSYQAITGANIKASLDASFTGKEKEDGFTTKYDFDIDGSLKGDVDFKNETFDLTLKGSVDGYMKMTSGGTSAKMNMDASTEIQARNNGDYVYLDGSAKYKQSGLGITKKDSMTLKNYVENKDEYTGESKVDLDEVTGYFYENDKVDLEEIYDLFSELNQLGNITISKTTEKTITFEFEAGQKMKQMVEQEVDNVSSYEDNLPFDLDFNLYMYISIDTELFLPTGFGFECDEDVKMDSGSGSISVDFDFKVTYGQYTVDNSEIDHNEYKSIESLDDDFGDDYY